MKRLFKTAKLGDKLTLTIHGPTWHVGEKPKTYSATVVKKTGVAMLVRWRNQHGTHQTWVNQDLYSASIWGREELSK